MGRLLGRLRSKSGSVLFLVVMVMSLLIIAASATLYIVNNQQSATTVRYNSEQSYQTAKSMSNAVVKYVNGYLNAIMSSGEKEIGKYNNTIIGKMLQGETITTNDIDLKAIGLSDSDAQKINVTIKPSTTPSKKEQDNIVTFFEVEVTAECDGETTTITQVIGIETGPAEYFTRFLTSTGRRSEDVIVSAYQILSGAYFENEFTRLSGAHMNDSVYVTGTLVDDGIQYHRSMNGSLTNIYVNDNYYSKDAGGTIIDVNEVYVGGNFICGKQILADTVYVLGDYTCNISQGASNTVFYIDGDCYLNSGTTNGSIYQTFYINGNLYLNNLTENHGEFHVKKNVIIPKDGNGCAVHEIECGGKFLYADGTEVSPSDGGSFDGEPAPTKWYSTFNFTYNKDYLSAFDDENVANVVNNISNKTSKNKYGTWDAEGYFNKTFPDAKTIKPNDPEYSTGAWDSYTVTIKESCRLQPAEWSWGKHYIIIDASENDIYIYLDNNGLEKDGRKYFSFDTVGDAPVNIVVKGTHSVIFVLPKTTDFKIGSNAFVGHIGMAKYMTGKSSDDELINGENIRNSFVPSEDNIKKIQNLLIAGDNNSTILDRGKLDSQTHNNIFLVTSGDSNYIDIGGESTFCGYIYAPSTVMRCNENSQTIGFIGGLIMGSYTYKNQVATLAFTTPYDYDGNYGLTKKTDIVKALMSMASTGSAEGAGNEFKGAYVVGYK